MAKIIYIYRADPAHLRGKYPDAQLQIEFRPLAEPGLHQDLESLVSRKLKAPAHLVVENFKELGDRFDVITRNIELITGYKHKVTIESKDVTFESLDQFNQYFKEFIEVLGKVKDEEGDDDSARPGRPEILTEEMKAVVRELRSREKPPSFEKVARIVSKTYGVEISKEVCWHYMRRLNESLPPDSRRLEEG